MENSQLTDNKALVQRWFDQVWNAGRAEAIEEMLAADAVVQSTTSQVANDRKSCRSLA